MRGFSNVKCREGHLANLSKAVYLSYDIAKFKQVITEPIFITIALHCFLQCTMAHILNWIFSIDTVVST